jgi:hypothetical protein
MNAIKNLVVIAVVLLMVLTVVVLYNKSQYYKALSKTTADTIYVRKPYPVTMIKTKYIERSVKVIVYLKDTNLRNSAESKDIITGIELSPSVLTIDKIKSTGEIFSSQYAITPFREIKIDGQGNLQIKKKRYWGLKILGTAMVAATGAYLLLK